MIFTKKKLLTIFLIICFFIIIYIIVKILFHDKLDTYEYNFNNLENYKKRRNEWIKKNSKYSLENKNLKGFEIELSQKEIEFNKYLIELLKDYISQYDPQRSNDPKLSLITPKSKFPPHCYFPGVKSLYENNEIFEILNNMPKGGLLHIHSGAIADLDWILEKGIFINNNDGYNCYINLEILNNDNPYQENQKDLFKFSNIKLLPENKWIIPDIDFIRNNKEKIKDRMTMTDKLAEYESPVVWKVFELINARYSELRNYPLYTIESWSNGLLKLAQNGIHHVDIRLGFGDSDRDKMIYGAIDKILTFNKAKNFVANIYPDFTIKIILSTPRIYNPNMVLDILEVAYQLKSGLNKDSSPLSYIKNGNIINVSEEDKYILRNLIIGYDLIAEEDPNYPTIHYAEVWIKAPDIEKRYNKMLKTSKITLPFYFHDGESDWTMNENVVDAVMLGAKRIGHGFNISFFPFIKKELIKKDICLEICPISNQILQYFKDLRVHSANSLFREGVPMVLSTDDPVMFGYTGLTYDFWVATVSWGLDLKAIKRLVFNSILYSSLSSDEIKKSIEYLTKSWNSWIDFEYKKITNSI